MNQFTYEQLDQFHEAFHELGISVISDDVTPTGVFVQTEQTDIGFYPADNGQVKIDITPAPGILDEFKPLRSVVNDNRKSIKDIVKYTYSIGKSIDTIVDATLELNV